MKYSESLSLTLVIIIHSLEEYSYFKGLPDKAMKKHRKQGTTHVILDLTMQWLLNKIHYRQILKAYTVICLTTLKYGESSVYQLQLKFRVYIMKPVI